MSTTHIPHPMATEPAAPASGPLFADYVEEDDDEVFVLDINHRFNVTDLLRRLERGQVPCQSGFVDIVSWRASLAQSGIRPCGQYANELPAERLQVPVVCVTLAGGALLVIDGNHRLAKADAAGLPGLPAQLIDQATTEALRLLYEECY